MKTSVKIVAIVLVVILVVAGGVVAWWFTTPKEVVREPVKLTVAAVPPGTATYPIIAGGVEAWKITLPGGSSISVIAGSGPKNIVMVAEGTADLGSCTPVEMKDAIEGRDPFKQKYTNIRALYNHYGLTGPYTLVTSETVPITSIKELVEKKYPAKIVLQSPMGSLVELYFRRMMQEYGVTYDDIKSWGGNVIPYASAAEAAGMFRDGHADFFSIGGGYPVSALVEITATKKVRVLSIDEKVIAALCDKYGYSKLTLPAGAYNALGTEKPFATFGVKGTMVICRPDLTDWVAYAIVKGVCENPDLIRQSHPTQKDWSPAIAWEGTICPLHPAAEKYYKEKGYMK